MVAEIEAKLSRDSVCMGDDIEDHTKIINITLQQNTTETLMCIAKGYLPSVAGFGHKWDCVLNGEKCAVISGNCVDISLSSPVSFSEQNDLYFKYHSATY